MRKTTIIIIVLFVNLIIINAKKQTVEFKTVNINKKLTDFKNQYDLSTPLKSFITFKYLQLEGKKSKYRSVNSFRIRGAFPKETTSDIEVSDKKRAFILNNKIEEVLYYKDSVAAVLSPYVAEPMYIIYYYSLEEGKWLGAGEGLGNDLNDARARFKKNAPLFLDYNKRIETLKSVPERIDLFVNYLKNSSKAPKVFLLNALKKHKIVVYGEIHRRKASWDLLKSIIKEEKFSKNVDTVFMELSSDKQEKINSFFSSRELNTEIILDIFRDVQISGWYDKGMYEFLIDLWKLNKKLPKKQRIDIILVDESRPFNLFKTKKELEEHFNSALDRNEQMAKIISTTIKSKKSKRNNFFIVGYAHAYKSSAPGIASGKPRIKAKPTAVAQLVKIFSDKEVFTICSHGPIISNNGTIHGKVRQGVFDRAFAEYGNKPLMFNLKNSPFGKEPFDGIYEISYDKEVGSYQNNYDSYLYLGSLESECEEYFLYEILTDDYVKELRRRSKMVGSSIKKWFGVKKETKEALIKHFKEKYEGKKRWRDI